ncbi:helix-turn-helix transcriptional regulator [uncultured Brevundimonas sp.]|uniref:helix-turn-helix domain-containing protein n=1 Tax=uncultured Brevundimonas sp. TaxID=213418 RepID=UPI0034431FCE
MKPVHIDTTASGTATEVDVLIGGIIRDRRAALGLAQAELGKAIGVTFQQVQKYERGVNRVAAATLLKVADALQCSVGNLYGDPDPDGRSPFRTRYSQAVGAASRP